MTPLLRLQAYTPGPWNAAAREAAGCGPVCNGVCPTGSAMRRCPEHSPDHEFVTGLIPLYLAAAPRGEGCKRDHSPYGHHPMDCEGIGGGPDPHALLRLAVDVGRACWPSFVLVAKDANALNAAASALDAAEAWIKDPSEERQEACFRVAGPLPHWAALPCFWIDDETICETHGGTRCECFLRDAIASAMKPLGREAFGRCAVERVSVECCECEGTGDDGRGNPHVLKKTCQGCSSTGRLTK